MECVCTYVCAYVRTCGSICLGRMMYNVCVYVVCFIVAAAFISHILKMLKRGMEVRGYYGQAYWKSVR